MNSRPHLDCYLLNTKRELRHASFITLKSDQEAQNVFIGENAELFNTSNWQDTSIKGTPLK